MYRYRCMYVCIYICVCVRTKYIQPTYLEQSRLCDDYEKLCKDKVRFSTYL